VIRHSPTAAVALLRAGRPHLAFVDVPDTDPAERRLPRELGMESSAAVPIVYEGSPATLAIMRDGGAFHVDAEDRAADVAQQGLLVRRGCTQLLAAGASGQLAELYGDGATLPMGWAMAALRLVVREAASPAAPSGVSAAR